MTDNPRGTLRNEIGRTFDTGFYRVVSPLNSAYASEVQSGRMALRLQQLQNEAQRLADLGQSLDANNPVLRAFLADLDDALANQAQLAGALGSQMQNQAIQDALDLNRLLMFGTITDGQLAQLGVVFNRPSPETLSSLLNFVSGPAWRDRLRVLPDSIFQTMNNQIFQMIVMGKNPLAIARRINEMLGVGGVPAYPLSQLNALMRTLQLTSYREASRAIAVANADLINHKIRVAALDDRTCLACIALHGTEMEVDARVDDHYSGRCIAISVVKGRPRYVQSGVDWFNGLPPERQQLIAGIGNFNALNSGAVSLADFVHDYEDDIFGHQIVQASLRGILGGQAQRFYAR